MMGVWRWGGGVGECAYLVGERADNLTALVGKGERASEVLARRHGRAGGEEGTR